MKSPPSDDGGSPRLHGGLSQANAGSASGGRRLKATAASVLVAVLVSVVGCGAGGGGGNATEQAEGPAGADASRTTTAPEIGSEAPESRDDGFVASAESSGGEAGAADRIEGVRFQIFDDYERLLIDFGGRDGEASGVPRWSVESPAEGGYVRVRFPGVTSTAITDKDFVGSVLNEMYVVRDRGGGLFADVFALHAFRYRVTELPESGQLAVDFRGVREELDLPPTTSDRAVVARPREAEEVSSPLTVEGYSRVPGALTNVSLIDRDGDVIASTAVRAEGDAGTWLPYTATLEFSGHEGLATLRVGGMSPRVGPRGVTFKGAQTEVFLE